MLTVERNSPSLAVTTRRVAGFPKEVGKLIHRWISQLPPEVNVDVAATDLGIRLHVWTDRFEEVRYVHPEDYVNDDDPIARKNPSFAASMVGVAEILTGLRLVSVGRI